MEICNNPDILRVIMYIKIILKYVFVFVPIGLILMMSIDFFKNIIASREDDMKKNTNFSFKRIIFCVILFFVPTIVSLVINIIDDTLGTENTYLACITNAESNTIDEKNEEYAKKMLDDALLGNSYIEIDNALLYINKIKNESRKNELQEMAETAKNAIISEIKELQEEEEIIRKTTVTKNSEYYYYNLESPDSQNDYTIYVDPDPNYVSRAVNVTDEEKKMIITTITSEMGGCKAGAVTTAQTIRDAYLYLSVFDDRLSTITGVIKYGFTPSYIYDPKTSANAEWAYNYVFVQGNSFYPRKFVGQRGFVSTSNEKQLGYYEVLKLKTHYDDNGAGEKVYITDPTYANGYNLGNSKLDTGGEFANYVNPNVNDN